MYQSNFTKVGFETTCQGWRGRKESVWKEVKDGIYQRLRLRRTSRRHVSVLAFSQLRRPSLRGGYLLSQFIYLRGQRPRSFPFKFPTRWSVNGFLHGSSCYVEKDRKEGKEGERGVRELRRRALVEGLFNEYGFRKRVQQKPFWISLWGAVQECLCVRNKIYNQKEGPSEETGEDSYFFIHLKRK